MDYLRLHIDRMREAIDEGVEVVGYCPGLQQTFNSIREGFVHVEKKDNFKRRRKKSFYWYKKVIESNGEIL